MKTIAQIKANLGDVTPEQVGRCHKAYDFQTQSNFYLVESESVPTEYKVSWSKKTGFTCTCPSGKQGFSNVHHPSGICKHIRWAVACSIEEDLAMDFLAVKTRELAIEKKWNLPAWMLDPSLISRNREIAPLDEWIG